MSSKQIKVVYDEEVYNTYMEDAKRVVEVELSNIVPLVADLGLLEKIKYVLQTRGKRLRPILVLLSAQSVGGRIETVGKLALAIEMLHVATLVHDDILDEDMFRRNELTVNAKWGVRDAVLVGDALASLSLYLSADYESEIVKIFSRTCLLLSDGEYMDVEEAMDRRKERDYLETIRRKSASLFKASTQCAAIAANASRDETDALTEFGENFGLAYQIRDDVADIIPFEDALPQDIKEFRATLPIIHMFESAKPEVRDELFQAIAAIKAQNSHEKIALNILREGLESTGSLRYCIDKINQYIDNAITSLEPLKECVYKDYLIGMAGSLRLKY
jgi:geranylgeranyl pyrophosphate synthase